MKACKQMLPHGNLLIYTISAITLTIENEEHPYMFRLNVTVRVIKFRMLLWAGHYGEETRKHSTF